MPGLWREQHDSVVSRQRHTKACPQSLKIPEVTPQVIGRVSLRWSPRHRSPSCNYMSSPDASMSPTAHTAKHTGLMLVGPQGYSWLCFQLTSQCYENTESPRSRGRRTLQQCLGGDTAARLCSKSGKSQLKVQSSKVGNNSLSHEECGFCQLQSGTKGTEMTSVASGQCCKARSVQPGPALPGSLRVLPWAAMQGGHPLGTRVWAGRTQTSTLGRQSP